MVYCRIWLNVSPAKKKLKIFCFFKIEFDTPAGGEQVSKEKIFYSFKHVSKKNQIFFSFHKMPSSSYSSLKDYNQTYTVKKPIILKQKEADPLQQYSNRCNS